MAPIVPALSWARRQPQLHLVVSVKTHAYSFGNMDELTLKLISPMKTLFTSKTSFATPVVSSRG